MPVDKILQAQRSERVRTEDVKTVRFTKIVEETGNPEPYTLWSPPEKDRRLQAAIKAHRVMTVHQPNTGAASDFGEIGFVKNVEGSFLLFPKSLQRYAGRRVVGIKYELLKGAPAEPPAAANRKRKAKKAKPKLKQTSPSLASKFKPLRLFFPEESER